MRDRAMNATGMPMSAIASPNRSAHANMTTASSRDMPCKHMSDLKQIGAMRGIEKMFPMQAKTEPFARKQSGDRDAWGLEIA